jgi:hypothetical protein
MTKIKVNKEARVISTYEALNQGNAKLLWAMTQEITPTNGPWFKVIQLLKMCDKAFNESAATIA